MSSDLAWRVFARQIGVVSMLAAILSILGTSVIHRMAANEADFGHGLTISINNLLPRFEESLSLERQSKQMLQRQRVIESLDARRSTSVLILNDLASALPKDIYLLRITEDGSQFTVEGRAIDPTAIARFLEKLSASAYLREMTLGEIRFQESDSVAPYQFAMAGKVRLVNAVVAGGEQ